MEAQVVDVCSKSLCIGDCIKSRNESQKCPRVGVCRHVIGMHAKYFFVLTVSVNQAINHQLSETIIKLDRCDKQPAVGSVGRSPWRHQTYDNQV